MDHDPRLFLNGRLRSFEAEAWPFSVYRYDARPPSVVAREGFLGWADPRYVGSVGGDSPPNVALFGGDTVFGAASRGGAENYLRHDLNIYRRGDGVIRRWQALQDHAPHQRTPQFAASTLSVEDAVTPKLYRIRADTHRALPLRELYERYGDTFVCYTIEGGRTDLNRTYLSSDFSIFEGKSPAYRRGVSAVMNAAYTRYDEVHVKGPVRAGRHGPVDSGFVDEALGLGRDIEHVSVDYLDLAV